MMLQHTVMLVDDDANLRSALARALHKDPYRIIPMQSAGEALKFLSLQPVDLVVTDQEMPGMQGTDFLAQVRQKFPDVVRIILTGKASIDVAIQAINEGQIYRFFTKPANPADLSLTIKRALRERDLALKSRRLLKIVQRQTSLLEKIEEEHPGITNLQEDRDGCFVLPGKGVEDDDTLLQALQQEIDRFQARIATGKASSDDPHSDPPKDSPKDKG